MSLCISVASQGIVASDSIGFVGSGEWFSLNRPKFVTSTKHKIAIAQVGYGATWEVLRREFAAYMLATENITLVDIEDMLEAVIVKVDDPLGDENDFVVQYQGCNYSYQANVLVDLNQDVMAIGVGTEQALTFLDFQDEVNIETVKASIDYVAQRNLYVGGQIFIGDLNAD